MLAVASSQLSSAHFPHSPMDEDTHDNDFNAKLSLRSIQGLTELISNPIQFTPAREIVSAISAAEGKYVPLDDSTLVEKEKNTLTKSKPFIGPLMPNSAAPSAPTPSPPSAATNTKAGPKQLHTAEIPSNWPKGCDLGRGLNNNGNTCFLNSVLQSLLHTPRLLQMVIPHSGCNIKGFCMTCQFREVLLLSHAHKGKGSFTPGAITRNLKQIAKTMRHGRQEDSHEFLRYTIDAFQRAALDGMPAKLPHSVKETTWVHKIFGGRLRSRVTCGVCKHSSDTFDSILDLSIDVRNRASVREALQSFVAVDVLSGADKYKCEKCKKPVNAEKRFSIHEAPQVLTVHLKRFTPLGRKLTHQVQYDEKFSLAPYMSEGQVGPKYTLYAVISHAGGGPNSGHYFAHVKSANGRWFEMNDESVGSENRVPLNLRNAYVLFYEREKSSALDSVLSAIAMGPPATPIIKRKATHTGDDDEDIGQRAEPTSSSSGQPDTAIAPPLNKKPKLNNLPLAPPSDPAAVALANKIKAKTSGLDSLSLYADDDDDGSDKGGEKAEVVTPSSPIASSSKLAPSLMSPPPTPIRIPTNDRQPSSDKGKGRQSFDENLRGSQKSRGEGRKIARMGKRKSISSPYNTAAIHAKGDWVTGPHRRVERNGRGGKNNKRRPLI